MLTVEEAGWSLKVFKILAKLNIIPISVDVKRGKIRIQKQSKPKSKSKSNRVKFLIWKIFFGVGVSRSFYVFGRLVHSILEPEKYFRWDHFILHFGLNLFWAVFYFTGFRLFVKTPEENEIIFNQLFEDREDPVQKMMDQSTKPQMNSKSRNGNGKRVCAISAWENKTRAKTGARLVSKSAPELHEKIEMEVIENRSKTEAGSKIRPRPLLTWPPKYSLDELVAKLFALLLVPTAFFTILLLAVDPSRPQLLYSALPPECQNAWSFLILLAVEALCTAIPIFTCSFSLVTQVLFFGKCQLEFKRINLQLRNLREKFQNQPLGSRDIEKEIWLLRQILKEVRELVVLIELFNRCFPFCIFAFKICSLSISIVQYFFFIRHFEDFPILAAFLCYIAIAHTLTYIIMYSNAFSIPGKMDELKNEFLLTAQKTTKASNFNVNLSKNLRAEMKREIKRIHGVGIKVGSFHQMERESTPIFVNFVLTNVVNLLVTFPR